MAKEECPRKRIYFFSGKSSWEDNLPPIEICIFIIMFVSLVCPCILFCVISVRPSIHANMGSCLFANFIFTWLQNCYLIVLSYLSSCLHTRCWYMCVSWHRTRSWLLAPCILLVMSWGLLRSDLFGSDIQFEVHSGSNIWCVPGLTWLARAEISTAWLWC